MHARLLTVATTGLLIAVSGAAALGQAGTIYFTGLEFYSVGDSTMAIDPQGRLLVGTDSGSGQAGIGAQAPYGDALTFVFADPINAAATTNVEYTLRVTDTLTDTTTPFLTLSMQPAPGGAGLDVLIGNTGGDRIVEVEVLDDDVVVDGRIITAENFDPLVPVWTIDFNPEAPFIGSANGGVWKTTNGGAAIGTCEIEVVEVAGGDGLGRAVTNDLRGKVLRITVKGGDITPTEVFHGADLLIGGLTGFEIEKASIRKFGFDHSGAGDATLVAEADRLNVSNIGSSGQNGVDIDVDGKRIQIDVEPNGDGHVDARDYLIWRSNFGATASTTVDKDAQGSLMIGHGAAADSTRTVRLYSGQLLITDDLQIQGPGAESATVVASIASVPPGDGVERLEWSFDDAAMTLRTEIRLTSVLGVMLPGSSSPMQADRIVILNSDPPEPTIDELRIRSAASGPLGFVILAESGAPPCPTDLTEDGKTDGADLAALLAQWGQAGSLADFNGDGVVDGADLAALLSSWGQCD